MDETANKVVNHYGKKTIKGNLGFGLPSDQKPNHNKRF